MTVGMKAIETSGTIDQQRRLILDEPLPVAGPTRVCVIILLSTEPPARAERKRQLAAAVQTLLRDYSAGGELTVFTALDGERFPAQG